MAVMEGGEPVVIPNAEGPRTTPSVVAITEEWRAARWPGGEASGRDNPENTVFSIKRLMGRKLDDPEVQRDLKLLPYRSTPPPTATPGSRWAAVATARPRSAR